jgi:lipid-A-disaccharide synthase
LNLSGNGDGSNGNGWSTTQAGQQRTICILAGDVSGDQNGGRLARAIRAIAPDVRLVGAGGPAMAEAGVEVLIQSTHVSMVGLPDSMQMVPLLVKVYLQMRRLLDQAKPDVAVLIDNESMNLMLAGRLRRRGIPRVFFFPPQVWFWGRWRIRGVVKRTSRVLCAFRTEAALYREAGADTIWVGHPLRDSLQITEDPIAAMREIGLNPARPLVALMPGSRKQEVKFLAAPILGAARILQSRDASLQFALPMASENLREALEREIAKSAVRDVKLYRPQSYAVLSQAKVALQCSGTATIETALLEIPSVITYRCNWIAYEVGRRLMKVPYIGMVNILFGEMVQPEYFQKNVDAEHLADEVWSLLTDAKRFQTVRVRLSKFAEILGAKGVLARAAQSVIELLPSSPLAIASPFLERQERGREDSSRASAVGF